MVALDISADDKAVAFNAFALIIAIADYKSVSSLPRIVHNDASDIRNTLIAQNHCGYLRQGGGDHAFLKTLLAEALNDFPNHKTLRELASGV